MKCLSTLGARKNKNYLVIFMNFQYNKSTPIREHIMKLIAYVNEAEILVTEIDNDTQISMVLNTLSNLFNKFCVDYDLYPRIILY